MNMNHISFRQIQKTFFKNMFYKAMIEKSAERRVDKFKSLGEFEIFEI